MTEGFYTADIAVDWSIVRDFIDSKEANGRRTARVHPRGDEQVCRAVDNDMTEAKIDAIDGGTAHESLKPEDFVRNVAELPALIALANAALPDSDPRKITRQMVALLRDIIDSERDGATLGEKGIALDDVSSMERIADALESYLPPVDG